MNRTTHYSPAFKEAALQKAFNRGDLTIAQLAAELNLNVYTLKNWMRNSRSSTTPSPTSTSTPSSSPLPKPWTAEQRLTALNESHGLSGEALSAWCREQGLFTHQLIEWKQAFCQPTASDASTKADKQTLKDLTRKNLTLTRELNRKDKALAEAAALLVLQKKYQALFEDADTTRPLHSAKP